MSTWTCVSRIHGSCGQMHDTLSAAARCCQQFEVMGLLQGLEVNRLPYERVGLRWEPISLTQWRKALDEMHEGARLLAPGRRSRFHESAPEPRSPYPQLPAPPAPSLPAPQRRLLNAAS